MGSTALVAEGAGAEGATAAAAAGAGAVVAGAGAVVAGAGAVVSICATTCPIFTSSPSLARSVTTPPVSATISVETLSVSSVRMGSFALT